ncbi:TIGR04141 family sporadically distributed protein [Janthinobacterium lividum]|nr:TIGR04141 family sporadically distributed protein [Janthinobacterium lividum]
MSNTYNIYKIQESKIDLLKIKLENVGLKEQKTCTSGNYIMTFYFSSKVEGNKIWWWQTYKDFFLGEIKEPENFFHFAVLLCCNKKNKNTIYAVSLGKSHFYLSKFIQPDFGITLAVRMAKEKTILLKKSRHFSGIKRQDVSSYENFQINSYEPGESVDHLKLKASNEKIWGSRNIIFADSIQMDIDKSPKDLAEIFDNIEAHLKQNEIIQLPKLEKVDDNIVDDLDVILFNSLKNKGGKVVIDEFTVYGIAICFAFHDYSYRISARLPGKGFSCSKNLGNSFDISDITEFLVENPGVDNVNSIRIQFSNEERGSFTKGIKEVIDSPIDYNKSHYFLRNGSWYRFNQTFMDYLKRSIGSIEISLQQNLIEKDFIKWKSDKELAIAAGVDVDDKLLYRESYFNKKLCEDHGYLLLDRQLTQIKTLKAGKSKYKVEIADLYKDNEIISVKISEANHELIYNIEQSKDSLILIKRNEIEFPHELTGAALWFVFDNNVKEIIDVNSIQFLLAIESWQALVKSFGLKPKIYISKHIPA